MQVLRKKLWVARHQAAFQGQATTLADPPRTAGARRRRPSARPPIVLDCPRTRTAQPLDRCQRCRHLAGMEPVPHRRLVTLTCVCSDADSIVGSAEQRSAWPTLDPDAPGGEARRLARLHDAPLVLVAREEIVVGVVYREQPVDADAPIATSMTEYPWALSTRATLGDAVEALRLLGVAALLVLGPESDLVAVASPEHFAHLGVPADLLGMPAVEP